MTKKILTLAVLKEPHPNHYVIHLLENGENYLVWIVFRKCEPCARRWLYYPVMARQSRGAPHFAKAG